MPLGFTILKICSCQSLIVWLIFALQGRLILFSINLMIKKLVLGKNGTVYDLCKDSYHLLQSQYCNGILISESSSPRSAL
jgi:hypothetical protein